MNNRAESSFLSTFTAMFILWFAAFAVGVIGTSMAFSLYLRMTASSVSWDQLSLIAGFFGGHVNGIAIVFVVAAMGLQMLQMRDQAKQSEIQRQYTNLHIAQSQYDELAASIPFAVRAAETTDLKTQQGTGLFSLSKVIHDRLDDSIIVVSEDQLDSCFKMAATVSDLTKRLCDEGMLPATMLEKPLVPRNIDAFAKELVAKKNFAMAQVAKFGLPDDFADRLRLLIDSNWTISCEQVGNSGFVAVARRDSLHDRSEVHTDFQSTTDGAYRALLDNF